MKFLVEFDLSDKDANSLRGVLSRNSRDKLARAENLSALARAITMCDVAVVSPLRSKVLFYTAKGFRLTFTGNPANNETMVVNGVTLTAKTSGANNTTEFNIGANPKQTVDNLYKLLYESKNINIFGAATPYRESDLVLRIDAVGTRDLVVTETLANVALATINLAMTEAVPVL